MHIRRLTSLDASAFQALRLSALRDSPSAFGSSYDEEKDIPVTTVEARLVMKPDRGIFGAFEDDTLVGMIGLGRESMKKLVHKAFVWGMYVGPEVRGKGIARALLQEAISVAGSVPSVQQINLSVNASNAAAIRLYQSAGFTVFGCEPGALLIDGELHDETHMYLRLKASTPLR
ncbi:Protein N-acetyltransferase, RimJ/RimL family [Polaromonas sp. OV174]|uniref:GNAT family N-acetyltransferase n=1 Tax=Polaromonas sp. OV174 TaxID=1855300 RepID=UPI0008E37B97|nr:GNAT family N-acetyltransferase [Polaromonas sp. OV174]SFC71110.1 Protein N-acetyltransferase, RimJ/RimL family [Polaromonas sp. OV174]